MLTWSNLAKFQKMLRDAHRPEVPRELGPTVTVKEAAALLGQNAGWVRRRIAQGRLNAWKDPRTRLYHVLLDELQRLPAATSDNPEGQGSRQPDPADDEEDDIRPFSHDTYGAAGVLEDAERESERRYRARLAQLDAELAALRAELGIAEDEEPATDTTAPPPAAPNPPTLSNLLPPELGGRGGQSKIQNPKSKIETPFPAGWVDWSTAAAMLGLTKGCFNRLAIRAGLERRRVGPGRTPCLYDSAAVAELADQRLAASAKAHPNRRIDWWGRRSTKIELGEFDYWITRNEAAELLNVRPRRISGMCAQGLLPCYQKEPGKRGSQLWVSYSHVVLLRDRPEYRKWRAVWERGRQRKEDGPSWYESEEPDIRPFPYRGESPASARDHGDYYTTRQAANVLGVAPSIVREHMRRGRLTGVHRPRHGKGRTGRQWWFVKKEEVHALQADPDYARRRRQYRDSLRARSVLADPPSTE